MSWPMRSISLVFLAENTLSGWLIVTSYLPVSTMALPVDLFIVTAFRLSNTHCLNNIANKYIFGIICYLKVTIIKIMKNPYFTD